MSDTPMPVRGDFVSSRGDDILSECAADFQRCTSDDPECIRSEKRADVFQIHTPDNSQALEGRCRSTVMDTSGSTPLEDPGTTDDKMSPVSLTELAYLRRLQKYHTRRRSQAEQRLHILRTSWAVRSRLVQSRGQLLGELSKAIRSEDELWFTPIFQAFHTVEAACEDFDRIECPLPPDGGPKLSIKDDGTESFLCRLPRASRNVLIHFIAKISSGPDFLLRHLSSLSKKEFDSLLRYHITPESSVLRSSERSHSGAQKGNSRSEHLDAFLDLGRRDFLSLVLNIVSPDLRTASHARSMQYWAKICAGLLSDQKPGADKFVVAILDAWSVPETQLGLPALENWLLELLREGNFLLEKPDKYSFRVRAQSRGGTPMGDTDSSDAFFARFIHTFLELLRDNVLTDVIPEATLKLGRAIVHHLGRSTKRFQTASYFLCTRWLFSSYLTRIIRNPESFGLLLSHHISSAARRRILDELALRLQKLAFDVAYTWKHSAPVDPKLLAGVKAMVSVFLPKEQELDQMRTEDLGRDGSDSVKPHNVVALCPSDILTLVHGLFPDSITNMEFSVLSLGGSTVHSSASSTSGFSLFRHAQPGGEAMSGDWTAPRAEPEVATSHGLPHDFLRTQSPLPCRIPAASSDSLQDEIEEASLIAQLKLVCSDLSVNHDLDITTSHGDPFSEPWASIAIPRGYHYLQTGDKPLYDVSLLEPYADELFEDALELQGLPNRIKDAAYSLLDHLGDTKMRDTGFPTDTPEPNALGSTSSTAFSATLLEKFMAAALDSQRKGLFAKAQLYHQASNQIKSMLRDEPSGSKLTRAFDDLARITQLSIDRDISATEYCYGQAREFSMHQDLQLSQVHTITETLSRLREKMWYIASARYAGSYETLLTVTSALKIMGLPSRPQLDKTQPPLRHRNAGTSLHEGLALKSESAILELLAAPPGHGGPNKLSDRQIKLTTDWLQLYGIENICNGEERLHRFCQEVSRCVDSLVGDNTVDHPVLWSSELFRDIQSPSRRSGNAVDRASFISSAREQLQNLYKPQHHQPVLSRLSTGYHGNSTPSSFGSPQKLASDTGFTMFGRNSLRYSGSCSPTLTNSTSGTLWSSFTAGEQIGSSVTSLPSNTSSRRLSDQPSIGSLGGNLRDRGFLDDLKHNITGLLLSDVGNLFSRGSETDLAFWEGFDGRFATAISTPAFGYVASTAFGGLPMDGLSDSDTVVGSDGQPQNTEDECCHDLFSPKSTFLQLLHVFEVRSSPFDKVKILYEIQEMYEAMRTTSDLKPNRSSTAFNLQPALDPIALDDRTQRRLSELKNASNDSHVAAFRQLFLDPTLRPKTLFRDLQYIAALVPASILDNHNEGHAYWSATIAALSIKSDMVTSMIETADAIVQHHTLTRGHSFAASAAQAERDSATFAPSRPTSAAATQSISQYKMSDAAEMYGVAAREGDAVAQRELATLYLTHPDMMKRVIAPMTKAGDVFKGAAAVDTTGSKAGIGGRRGSGYGVGGIGVGGDKEQASGRGGEGVKYDPIAMAIARHWMELAAKNGDDLAKNTLKATDEIEKIPS